MGIRYYAWEIAEDEAKIAAEDPWLVIRTADDRYYEADWANTCLDKAWGALQRLLEPPDRCTESRPAYQLVSGDVTYPGGWEQGYHPYIAVRDPATVSTIHRDLRLVTEQDVRAMFLDEPIEADYVSYYLGEAKQFVRDVAERGHAIIYLIR